jgi:serine/threonine protein kinase
MTPSAGPRSGVALLIGVGDYRHRGHIRPLPYARRDARSLARLARAPRGCRFADDRVVLLTDAEATREALVRRLAAWLPRESAGAELVLVYFAGHGVTVPVGGRDEGFLLPHDADPDAVEATGVSMADVARWMGGLKAEAVVVLLDCCHAGGVLPEGVTLRGQPRDMAIRPELIQPLAGQGRFLIVSCGAGERSLEADELRHGLFTYHLLRGLGGAGDQNRDGRVGVTELFGYVAEAVRRDATRFGHTQTPWSSGTWARDVPLTLPGRRRDPTGPAAPADAPAGLTDELRALRARPDPARLPLVLGSLAHADEAVRRRAARALKALGWPAATTAALALARGGDEAGVAAALRGLEALEAHADAVALLDRLTAALHGEPRGRALELLDRKRLALGLDRLRAAFAERRSPYVLERVLGAGPFTAAYLARHETSGLAVVVRVLRPDLAARADLRGRFLDLGARATRLVHQGLLMTREVLDYHEHGLCATVRDHNDGVTLRDVLAGGRRFEPEQALRLLRQVLEALAPAHREGLAHGGVRPSNVHLTRDGRALLGDPALTGAPSDLADPRLLYGLRYAAPEAFGGEPGPTADLYAVGCVAWELFWGTPPFVADAAVELLTRHARDPLPAPAPGRLADAALPWLRRLLAKAPPGRYPDQAAALEGLEAVLAALRRPPGPGLASPTGPGPDVPPDQTGGPLLPEASLVRYQGRPSIVPVEPTVAPSEGGLSGPPPAPTAGPPAVVDGRYEILEELGRGGMGVVYRARQTALKRVVALKMVRGSSHAGPGELARFRREAEAVARIQHPNIMAVFEAGEFEGCPYLVLELMDGGNLAGRLATAGPLPPAEAAALVEVLARAMQAAHDQHILHRDLKPANVLFTADGTAKISDFGLARRQDDEHMTLAGQVLGTPAYMAPEQARGDIRAVGPAVDVYSLGAVLYECLTGRPPFRGATVLETLRQTTDDAPVPPRQLRPSVPRDLESICLKCLAKEPARRYASAAALADDLRLFLDGRPITARPPSRLERFWRWLRRALPWSR